MVNAHGANTWGRAMGKFRLASTKYNSQRGLPVDLTSQGTGSNHKFSIINSLDDPYVEPDDNFGFNETWTEY